MKFHGRGERERDELKKKVNCYVNTFFFFFPSLTSWHFFIRTFLRNNAMFPKIQSQILCQFYSRLAAWDLIWKASGFSSATPSVLILIKMPFELSFSLWVLFWFWSWSSSYVFIIHIFYTIFYIVHPLCLIFYFLLTVRYNHISD